MILDELILHDFGVYGGRQTITLTPPSNDKPVILFGGLNGAGKTTLLDALQLILYGPAATCSGESGLSYGDYLAGYVHRRAASKQAAIELAFRHTIDGVEEKYRLHRSWQVTTSGCKEAFEVICNGQIDKAVTENWAQQVEDFIPANISHLFLFDGERVESYAKPESAASLIRSGIHNLLGLDIVEQLDKDLLVYVRRKRTEEGDQSLLKEIEGAERSAQELRGKLDNLRQEISGLRAKQERKQDKLEGVKKSFRKLGGDLYLKREEIEERQSEAETKLRQAEASLRDLAASSLPFALVGNLMRSAASRDETEEQISISRTIVDVLKERDAQLFNLLRDQSAAKDTLEKLELFCQNDCRIRSQLAEQEIALGLSVDGRRRLHALLDCEINDDIVSATSLLEDQTELRGEYEYLTLELAGVPDEDAIRNLLEEQEKLESELADLCLRQERLVPEVEFTERELKRTQESLANLVHTDAKEGLKREDTERALKCSGQVRATLEHFREAVVRRHVTRIEQLVLECFQHLLRKTSLVSELRIDPINFELTLANSDGDRISPDRLSAGERQLLAVALLWGLAKASGRALPTAIDTPLGRLDTNHRHHLVERYFPYASHQVLLFSTDEEITRDHLSRLLPWVGRSYQLVFDDEDEITRVMPGYFEEREAA